MRGVGKRVPLNKLAPNVFKGVPSEAFLLVFRYMELNLKRRMKSSIKRLEVGKEQEQGTSVEEEFHAPGKRNRYIRKCI